VSIAIVTLAGAIQWFVVLVADWLSAALLAAAEPPLHRKRLARVLLRLSLRAGEFGRRVLQDEQS
jgi:hypothetical protein